MEITAAWMSEIFDADIIDVTTERIGDGLVGLNLRVAMTAADSARGASVPDSVVVKLPSIDETSRATGIALRNYEREVRFYEHIASTVRIRIPECHHGTWDEASGDFVLVLEDMAPAVQGDQIAGCTPEMAHLAVVELAGLHGPRWDDPTLGDHEFLTRREGHEDGAELSAMWDMFLPGFEATYGRYLDDDATRLLGAFGPKLADWVGGRGEPMTVTHGDYRLDNLLFGTDAGGPPVTAVDWQTPGHGSPVTDLAYFCGAGLEPEERRDQEASLIGVYVEALSSHGVDADEGWVWEQYRRDAFAGVIMSVIASQVVGGSDRSEAMFAAMASRHLQHCLDLDSLDAVGGD